MEQERLVGPPPSNASRPPILVYLLLVCYYIEYVENENEKVCSSLGLQPYPQVRWLDPPGTHPNHLLRRYDWSPRAWCFDQRNRLARSSESILSGAARSSERRPMTCVSFDHRHAPFSFGASVVGCGGSVEVLWFSAMNCYSDGRETTRRLLFFSFSFASTGASFFGARRTEQRTLRQATSRHTCGLYDINTFEVFVRSKGGLQIAGLSWFELIPNAVSGWRVLTALDP